MLLEACVETYQQAINAQTNGANRIELCGDLSVGGITPDLELVKALKADLNIPIMAMVRPRGGSFVFSKIEMDAMLTTIQQFKELEILGIVIGNLDAKKEIHFEQNQLLAKAAFPMNVTFHKAIDTVDDIFGNLNKLLEIKEINRILTSGGKPTAAEGAAVIREMIKLVGTKMTILSAGKITANNLETIHDQIGGKEYHGRLIIGEI